MSSLSPWRVLSSELIRGDRWIRLRADRCETGEGAEISPYYVLDYPDWVQVVAVGRDQRILLVEQYRHAAGEITLEIPAGGMDANDQGPEETARRELLEETGGQADGFRAIVRSSPNPASHSNLVHTVLATGVTISAAPLDDPRERLQARWVERTEAFALAMEGVLPAMQAASLLTAYQHLGWLQLSLD